MSVDSIAQYVSFLTVCFTKEEAAKLFADELAKEGYWVSRHAEPSGNPPQWAVHAAPPEHGHKPCCGSITYNLDGARKS